MTLRGKTALVTGGTSGIGRAVANLLAIRGADVIVTGRDQARGDEVVGGITVAGGKARFIAADLANFEDVKRLADAAKDVDVLVNNAGVFPGCPTDQMTEEAFDVTFNVNVKAPFFLTAVIAPRMATKGGGSIINISTMAATIGMNGLAAYGASKAAVESLTKAWTAEIRRPRCPRQHGRTGADPHPSERRDGRDLRCPGFEHSSGARCDPGRDCRRCQLPRFGRLELYLRRDPARRWRSRRRLSLKRNLHLDRKAGINMILITTAGKVGAEAARLLTEHGQPVRLLARNPEKVAVLSQAGVEVVEGDLEVPASIDAGMRDVSSVILVSLAIPNQELNVVDSAVRAGVDHVVKITSKASADSPVARRRPNRDRGGTHRVGTRLHAAAKQRLHAELPHAGAAVIGARPLG
jgi:NAD(P)-dependent dehydrogenase (short-subunit alcohol dehydrogenase family)